LGGAEKVQAKQAPGALAAPYPLLLHRGSTDFSTDWVKHPLSVGRALLQQRVIAVRRSKNDGNVTGNSSETRERCGDAAQ
jgi:hypothetical protein